MIKPRWGTHLFLALSFFYAKTLGIYGSFLCNMLWLTIIPLMCLSHLSKPNLWSVLTLVPWPATPTPSCSTKALVTFILLSTSTDIVEIMEETMWCWFSVPGLSHPASCPLGSFTLTELPPFKGLTAIWIYIHIFFTHSFTDRHILSMPWLLWEMSPRPAGFYDW